MLGDACKLVVCAVQLLQKDEGKGCMRAETEEVRGEPFPKAEESFL